MTIMNIEPPIVDKLDHYAREVLHRMYSCDMKRYQNRVMALNFTNKKSVLDAGCGFGQWSIALSTLNEKIYAVDINRERIEVAKEIVEGMGINNISFRHCSIDSLPFQSNSFDAVFCYSAILFTDYKVTLREFYRTLKPGGALYFATNGLGWYIYNIITNHNPSKNTNRRIYGFKTILETIWYSITKEYTPKVSLVMSPRKTMKYLSKIGYRNISVAGEGCIRLNSNIKPVPFYPARYLNLPNVFEVVAFK